MPRKKVDGRVRTLIENGVKTRTRSFFVIVGDRGKDQVVNLHYILSKAQVKARPEVLWCYNKELGFSTHRQKRMRQIKKLQAKGLYDSEKEDPFELFVSSTKVRWCYYKETHKILGQTYGMLVLQDYEAVTPNILCRAIETVEGGGIVVLLLRTMSSLKQLYSMTMDVHSRFQTEAHKDVVPRFNERFLLSLATSPVTLVLDDELNVLPISKHAKSIVPIGGAGASSSGSSGGSSSSSSGFLGDKMLADLGLSDFGLSGSGSSASEVELTPAQKELKELKSSLASTALVGSLVACTRTLDQAKAVLTFAEGIAEKTLRSTVALTAGRGRGKSASLGLAIAAAVGYGYSNIFVTSPSPENLKTLFEFIFKGLDALSYKEHADYEAIASTNPEYNGAIVRVNVFRGHRQTIQYIEARDADKLAQAELVVIDEAAAIPLPLVKRLLGPYLVFIASTVNGYEGTGRSLSLKLVQQLRQQQASGGAGAQPGSASTSLSAAGRSFREVSLAEPIRYAAGDGVEKWLTDLLCLDATTPVKLNGRLPAPSACELYAVDRDALFSYHKISESFLHRMMSLYVSSHYKNTPNDLQLMSDAPAHRLFVLLGPQGSSGSKGDSSDSAPALPDILCVVQVCLEGKISRETMKQTLSRGARSSGDLIPWTVSQQFQDDNFGSLSGARVVRIATHPDATKMGYGSRAIELLQRFYEGKMVSLGTDDDAEDEDIQVDRGLALRDADAGADDDAADEEGGADGDGGNSKLMKEKVKPRKQLPPLLVPVSDIRRPDRLHWIGVSYGLTLQLFNFWRRGGYLPVYLRQTANDLTAEHTMIMIRTIEHVGGTVDGDPAHGWNTGFVADFGRRYATLLSFEFRDFDVTLALSVMDAACGVMGVGFSNANNKQEEDAGDGGAAVGLSAAAANGHGRAVSQSVAGRTAGSGSMSPSEVSFVFTPHDLKRLESYARNLVDYHMVLDLLPTVAKLYFSGRLPEVSLPRLQAGILLAVGLQHTDVDAVAAQFNIGANQVLALFNKALRKVSNALNGVQERAVEAALDARLAAGQASAKAAASSSATKAKPAALAAAPAKPAAAASSSSSSKPSSASKASAAAAESDDESESLEDYDDEEQAGSPSGDVDLLAGEDMSKYAVRDDADFDSVLKAQQGSGAGAGAGAGQKRKERPGDRDHHHKDRDGKHGSGGGGKHSDHRKRRDEDDEDVYGGRTDLLKGGKAHKKHRG